MQDIPLNLWMKSLMFIVFEDINKYDEYIPVGGYRSYRSMADIAVEAR